MTREEQHMKLWTDDTDTHIAESLVATLALWEQYNGEPYPDDHDNWQEQDDGYITTVGFESKEDMETMLKGLKESDVDMRKIRIQVSTPAHLWPISDGHYSIKARSEEWTKCKPGLLGSTEY